jgi:hypothetical protein
VHKASNVENKLPRSVQPAAKADLREIWQAPDRATAEAAIASLRREVRGQIRKAVACLAKDRDALLAFYDFPGRAPGPPAHRQPDRERVRHRAAPHGAHQGRAVAGHRPADGVQARHGRGQDLAQAQRREPVAQGHPGVTFRDGVEVTDTPEQTAA